MFCFPICFQNIKIKISKSVFFPVGLYGCEAWFFVLREEHRLRMFENRELRKIFESKGDRVREEWGILHNEELCDLCSSPNIARMIISRVMRWAGMWHRTEA
jgi:hypothetical protein